MERIKFSITENEKETNGTNYKINIKFPMNLGWIDNVQFVIDGLSHQMNHLKNEEDYAYFQTEIYLATKAIYHYHFSFTINNNLFFLKNEEMKMSVNFNTPDWAKGKIMYHIFVDRFNRTKKPLKLMKNRTIHSLWTEDIVVGPDNNGRWNTDFYGGSIQGIIEKLDYIKSLGVSIIYLSPIFYAQSNHRYDTSDYENIDPYIGTNNDLKKLCDKAHRRGIKIIIDGVFNHTGNDSKYFNEYGNFPELGAYQSKESKYFPFYKTEIKDDKIIFDYWWGMKNLPVCDCCSKTWQNYIYGEGGIIDKWFSYGIDGLRLDVADELTDEFIYGIRKAVKRNKEDGLIIGEVWKNPMHMNRGYIESGKGMDSVMNYQLADALIRYFKYNDINILKKVTQELITEYPTDTLNTIMNFTSTHDISRAINIFSSNKFDPNNEWIWDLKINNYEEEKKYKLNKKQYNLGKKIYSAYLYTLTFMPGILSIFYGDEIGMEGMGNLANRRPFTWDKIDNEILNLFKNIGKIRNNESFLETANLKIIDVNDKYLVFKRYNQNEEILVYINRTNDNTQIEIPREYKETDILYNLNNSTKEKLKAYGGIVLKK